MFRFRPGRGRDEGNDAAAECEEKPDRDLELRALSGIFALPLCRSKYECAGVRTCVCMCSVGTYAHEYALVYG